MTITPEMWDCFWAGANIAVEFLKWTCLWCLVAAIVNKGVGG